MTIGCSELLARAMYGTAQSPWRCDKYIIVVLCALGCPTLGETGEKWKTQIGAIFLHVLGYISCGFGELRSFLWFGFGPHVLLHFWPHFWSRFWWPLLSCLYEHGILHLEPFHVICRGYPSRCCYKPYDYTRHCSHGYCKVREPQQT